MHPSSVHICGVVVEYSTSTGRTNKGVATTWLRDKQPGGSDEEPEYPRVPVYVRRSQFRLPNRPGTPVIMIGPGTGLAPFRGFIQVTKKLFFRNKILHIRRELGRRVKASLLDQLFYILAAETETRTSSTRRNWRRGRLMES